MNEKCTCWEAPNSSEQNPCNAPATHRRGGRCENGCYGEGMFDYSCPEHLHILDDDIAYECVKCMGNMTYFATQEILQ